MLMSLTFAAMAAPALAGPSAAELQQQNLELQAKVQALEAEIQQLRSELAQLKAKPASPRITESGELVQSRKVLFDTQYDPASKTTTLRSEQQWVRVLAGGVKHYMTLVATQQETQPSGQGTRVQVILDAPFAGGLYEHRKTVKLLADEAEVICPVVSYKARSRGGTSVRNSLKHYDEQLTFEVPAESLERIAGAKQLLAEIGPVRLEFSSEQQAMFAAVSQRIRRTAEKPAVKAGALPGAEPAAGQGKGALQGSPASP